MELGHCVKKCGSDQSEDSVRQGHLLQRPTFISLRRSRTHDALLLTASAHSLCVDRLRSGSNMPVCSSRSSVEDVNNTKQLTE
jgi:hypothetical protein